MVDIPKTLEQRKLSWACRRGMLELDIFLEKFLEHAYRELPEQEQACFRRLLTEPDPDLFAWLMGHADPEQADYASLCQKIRDCARSYE